MVDIDSSDYHDFVIKDGKLVAEFEQMYQKSKEIPWHQNDQDDWLDIRITLELLEEYSPFDNIYDLGCGIGYFLDIIKRSVGSKDCIAIGYDISPTCCKNAKEIFVDIHFHVFDLAYCDISINHDKKNIKRNNRLFMIRGVLWYIFPNMENVVKNIECLTKNGDFLLISQNFPPLKDDFVGKDTIPDPEQIIKWFNDYFIPLKTIWLEDRISKGNDNWFIGIFLRR